MIWITWKKNILVSLLLLSLLYIPQITFGLVDTKHFSSDIYILFLFSVLLNVSINAIRKHNIQYHEQHYRYKTLFDNSIDGICLLDDNKNIIDANISIATMFKYPLKELIGMNVHQLIHPDDTSNSTEFFKKLGTDGYYRKFEGRVICKDQSVIWIQVNSTSFSNNLIPSGSLDIIRDITERKEKENLIKHQTHLLQQLNQTKDRFFSIIAHDLRSPFQGIMGLNDLLISEFDIRNNDDNKELIKLVHKQSRNYYGLLETLLQWSSLQTNRTTFKPEKHALNKLIEEQVELVKPMLDMKNIAISSQIAGDHCFVMADKNMITSTLRNLLSNALKYTPNYGEISVSSELDKASNVVKIKVSDNGVGMAPEVKTHLFKLDKLQSTKGIMGESGHGLGLILCKEYIEKHGFSLEVESEVYKGTTLSFKLELAN
ncbi:PAS domain-containing sensor histidine kinase [Carboxylicivirga sp. M1479]|uniref:PAS domain-containing sensor histidine kinase n=1 Tax=Carboxylicivirga sp. M1479 TaxID=2594476 RepID=UPI00163DA592|nr:PAS domain-containing sensor histidine kinase [Carboxylicivirga sp. M1479]